MRRHSKQDIYLSDSYAKTGSTRRAMLAPAWSWVFNRDPMAPFPTSANATHNSNVSEVKMRRYQAYSINLQTTPGAETQTGGTSSSLMTPQPCIKGSTHSTRRILAACLCRATSSCRPDKTCSSFRLHYKSTEVVLTWSTTPLATRKRRAFSCTWPGRMLNTGLETSHVWLRLRTFPYIKCSMGT